MMSVGKIAATPTAGRYYVEQVSRGVEDYYAGEARRRVVWVGAGAGVLGLRGEVGEEGVLRLLSARHPASGEQLRRPLASGAVAGCDVTFRAPKSVSVLFGIADENVVREIRAAHRAAGRRGAWLSGARGVPDAPRSRRRRGGGGRRVRGGGV